MDQNELNEKKYLLEEKKFEIEKKSSNFMNKNFGVIITAIISFAAILVSISQIWIAEINKTKELEINQNLKEKEIDLNENNNQRQWNLDLLKYVTENSGKIFYGSYSDKEKFKNIMLVTIPPEITDKLFRNFEETVPKDDKKIWSDARKESASLRRSEISIQYFPKPNENINWDKFTKTLKENSFHLEEKNPIQLNVETNSIWFGDDIYVEDIKFVALKLIESGAEIKSIRPFRNSNNNKNKLIQIGADASVVPSSPLSEADILSASEFSR